MSKGHPLCLKVIYIDCVQSLRLRQEIQNISDKSCINTQLRLTCHFPCFRTFGLWVEIGAGSSQVSYVIALCARCVWTRFRFVTNCITPRTYYLCTVVSHVSLFTTIFTHCFFQDGAVLFQMKAVLFFLIPIPAHVAKDKFNIAFLGNVSIIVAAKTFLNLTILGGMPLSCTFSTLYVRQSRTILQFMSKALCQFGPSIKTKVASFFW